MKFNHATVDLGYEGLICETAPTGRTYLTPSGNKYPSITSVLGILSENDIREWRQRVGKKEADRVSRVAASRGTSVHTLVEDYLNNKEINLEKAKCISCFQVNSANSGRTSERHLHSRSSAILRSSASRRPMRHCS